MCLRDDDARQPSIYNAATSCIIHKVEGKFLHRITEQPGCVAAGRSQSASRSLSAEPTDTARLVLG